MGIPVNFMWWDSASSDLTKAVGAGSNSCILVSYASTPESAAPIKNTLSVSLIEYSVWHLIECSNNGKVD